ncbi:MAG: Hsp20/alpha crystallin family protein, partial [Planctomycetota bacterium]
DTAGFTICADMPGASADTIKMTFADGLLAVHAQVPPRPHATPDYLTHEFGVGDFDCQLSVSDAIEADGINASYERGVLTIRLPKRDEIKPRRIPVRDAQGTQ